MGYKNNDLFLAQATCTSWVNHSSAPCLHLDLFGDVVLWQKGERQRTISWILLLWHKSDMAFLFMF